ncbi:MAG TPA: DUF58 domain-containing protein [Acidimicrobiales bacterium]|nr:DUF58 domain-containing protein [Acidimicrobiales bacterium]
MLTRRGFGAVVGVVALAVAGRLLGVLELFVLAAGLGGLLVAGFIATFARRAKLGASRHVEPARVHVGDESRIDLVVENRGRIRSPVVTIRDSFDDGARQARFLLSPIVAGGRDHATYRLPADRRGRFDLGPLEAQRADPFGLVYRTTAIAPATQLTVYPAIEAVLQMAPARGHRPATSQPATTGPSGEDFATLRAYEVGDDLRQVHWPSTARLGELMIRQLDHPLEGHATVLLDLRSGSHTEASLERAVSAAASVLVACSRAGSLVRLTTTEGLDSGFGTGKAHVDSIMERLAVAEAGEGNHLAGAVGALSRSRHGGPSAFIGTDGLQAGELGLVARLQTRRRPLTVVLFQRADGASQDRGQTIDRASDSTTILQVHSGQSFAAVWNQAATRGVRGRAPAARGWG